MDLIEKMRRKMCKSMAEYKTRQFESFQKQLEETAAEIIRDYEKRLKKQLDEFLNDDKSFTDAFINEVHAKNLSRQFLKDAIWAYDRLNQLLQDESVSENEKKKIRKKLDEMVR